MTPPPEPTDGDLFQRPVLPQSWRLPRTTKIDRGNLIYTFSDAECRGDEGMLRRFLMLPSADDEAIADYAAEFGVLDLCIHDQPRMWPHEDGLFCSEPVRSDYERASAVRARGRNPAPPVAFREPLSTWRRTATAYRSVLELADRIERRVPSNPEHTRWLSALLPNGGYTRAADMQGADKASETEVARAQIEWDRWDLENALNTLLDRAVRTQVHFDAATERRPRMGFVGRSLSDALVVQTAMAVCRANAAASCDGCGTVFVPSNSYKPREGQRRFCDDCRATGVPQKFAARDRRARARERQEKP